MTIKSKKASISYSDKIEQNFAVWATF